LFLFFPFLTEAHLLSCIVQSSVSDAVLDQACFHLQSICGGTLQLRLTLTHTSLQTREKRLQLCPDLRQTRQLYLQNKARPASELSFSIGPHQMRLAA
jgi:hypothetical protein